MWSSLGPGSALREKGEKKISEGEKKKSASEASRELVWRGERVAEPGDMPLMPQIRPPKINLSLKCQHVRLSQMSAWTHYVAFVKKYLNSRWRKSASKEIYLTSIPPIFFLFDPIFCLFSHCKPGPRLQKNVSQSLQDSGEKEDNRKFKIRHLKLTSRSLKFQGYYPNSLT